MDIRFQGVILTVNQTDRLKEIIGGKITGAGYSPSKKELTLTAITALSPEEEKTILANISKLSNEPVIRETEKERILKVLGITVGDLTRLQSITAKDIEKIKKLPDFSVEG